MQLIGERSDFIDGQDKPSSDSHEAYMGDCALFAVLSLDLRPFSYDPLKQSPAYDKASQGGTSKPHSDTPQRLGCGKVIPTVSTVVTHRFGSSPGEHPIEPGALQGICRTPPRPVASFVLSLTGITAFDRSPATVQWGYERHAHFVHLLCSPASLGIGRSISVRLWRLTGRRCSQ